MVVVATSTLGTHRDRGIYTAMNDACGHTAESVVGRTHRALASVKHSQTHITVLQNLRKVISLHDVKFAFLIFKGEHCPVRRHF